MNHTLTTLRAKKNSKKGFTLMEMLIVVAIIAILVAVSIPVFTSQLEKARESTDLANERAAKAVAVADYLTNETTGTKYYDAANGKLIDTAPKTGYGKGTTAKPDTTDHSEQVIKVVIGADGTPAVTWVAKGA